MKLLTDILRFIGRRAPICLLFFLLVAGGAAYAQAGNPFDVVRSADETQEAPKAALNPDEKVKLDTDNPFSVDHIPIRKNQYQEIERLTATKSVAEENISLSYMPLWMLIISLCMLAYMLFVKKDHLSVLVKSLFNDNFMRMTNYEENSGWSAPYILGYLMFLLNFALFVYLISVKHFQISVDKLFLIILAISVAFFLGKHLVNTFFSWVFHVSKESKLYDFTTVSIYNIAGLFFLVINILVVFGPDVWLKALALGGALVFIIFLLSRYYKTLRIGHSQLNNNFFHFFLYFCTFEFSPWIIVYRVIKNLI